MTTRRMSKPLARNANGIKEVASSNVNGQIDKDKDKDKDKDMGSLAHINISRFETERVLCPVPRCRYGRQGLRRRV